MLADGDRHEAALRVGLAEVRAAFLQLQKVRTVSTTHERAFGVRHCTLEIRDDIPPSSACICGTLTHICSVLSKLRCTEG